MRIDVDRVARSSAAALRAPHRRPRASVSLVLRRMIDVFVGRVRSSNGDFYFDVERVLAGDPLERAVRRIGALAEAAERVDGGTFVDELHARGIRIAIDLPAFCSAFTARDANLVRMGRSPTWAVWFDGLQIRVRDTLLFAGVSGVGRLPASARIIGDLLESERSLRVFLAVVDEALGRAEGYAPAWPAGS